MTETQHKILDTAERLFAEHGYAGTSLRQIIGAAGVNVAAIHYHFGNKEELLARLVERKAGPVNQERLAMLDRFQAEAGSGPVPLESLIRAFLEPPLQRVKQEPDFARLMGRLYGEGLMPGIAARHFQAVLDRFTAAFGRALPHLSEKEVVLRLHFTVGAMAHTMLFAFLDSAVDPNLPMRQLMAFAAGGLRAPALLREMTGENL